MESEKTIRYTKEDLTVVWKPQRCIHSCRCWKELISVFDPRKRPWVDLNGAPPEQIRDQVSKCPSGALSLGEQEK